MASQLRFAGRCCRDASWAPRAGRKDGAAAAQGLGQQARRPGTQGRRRTAAIRASAGAGVPWPRPPSRLHLPWPKTSPGLHLSTHPSRGAHWGPGSGRRCTRGRARRCPGWLLWAGARAGPPGQGARHPGLGRPPPLSCRVRLRQTAPGRSPCSGGWQRPPAPRPRHPPRPTSWLWHPRQSLGTQFHTPPVSWAERQGESVCREMAPAGTVRAENQEPKNRE